MQGIIKLVVMCKSKAIASWSDIWNVLNVYITYTENNYALLVFRAEDETLGIDKEF